ncbi:hypothetical protein D3C83_86130 [compost metagenome]
MKAFTHSAASAGGIVYGRFIVMNATSTLVSALISGTHSVSPEKKMRWPPRFST